MEPGPTTNVLLLLLNPPNQPIQTIPRSPSSSFSRSRARKSCTSTDVAFRAHTTDDAHAHAHAHTYAYAYDVAGEARVLDNAQSPPATASHECMTAPTTFAAAAKLLLLALALVTLVSRR
ncbi:hypothetical protein CFE70_008859 [Pyrenophora teres f. teres 0-1]